MCFFFHRSLHLHLQLLFPLHQSLLCATVIQQGHIQVLLSHLGVLISYGSCLLANLLNRQRTLQLVRLACSDTITVALYKYYISAVQISLVAINVYRCTIIKIKHSSTTILSGGQHYEVSRTLTNVYISPSDI